MKIKNVVVIGSGTMGSGIAAHLCNANVPVTLLDLKTEISEKARERIHKSRPPLLIDKSKINNIKVGNISDNFDVVKNADWIVEAVVERIDVKHQIYEKIFKSRKAGAIVCNDTPGFLGNRVGVYAMQIAMTEAFKMKLSVEEADAIFGLSLIHI